MVTARCKRVKKTGKEGTGRDGCGVLRTGSIERGMGYMVNRNG